MGGVGSGVPSTPEHRAQKVAAGRARAAARREAAPPVTAAPLDGEMPQDRPASLADYDLILGRPVSWTDAKKREEVQGEIIANEQRADERAIARRQLYTREQVEERDRQYDDSVMSILAGVAELCAGLVEADKKTDARAKAKAWVTEARRQLSESVRRHE